VLSSKQTPRPEGNFYGVTANGGTGGSGGVVYELSPRANGWTFLPIYPLEGPMAGGSESQ
jgi:uncharacterized repeat protein (TIGR03803 family)